MLRVLKGKTAFNGRFSKRIGFDLNRMGITQSLRLFKTQLLEVIASLLDTRDIQLENEQSVEEAIYQWKEANADFADCLIAARHRRLGCSATATFDARAVKLTGFVAV